MMEGDDLVANFMAITGAAEDQASQMLEATNFDLSAAVDLFFAAHGDAAGANLSAPPPHDAGGALFNDDEALARQLQK